MNYNLLFHTLKRCKEIQNRFIGMSGKDPNTQYTPYKTIQQTNYYRPYDSEDESGSDSESSNSDSWYSDGMDQQSPPIGRNEEGIPNFHAFATQMQLRDAAGRSFSTIKDELNYGVNKLGKYTVYSEYDEPLPDISGEDVYGRTKFATQDGNITSIVMVDSRYRDRQAYPQPTFFTLRLPRIYKNVVNITLTDVKLLTSFYFFRPSKGNTDITVYEKDRMTQNIDGSLTSTIVKRYIQTGSYNIDSLQQELTIQLNYTPLFFDYPNGFNDFIGPFKATGDYFLNFNYPGDYFFNNTTNLWIPNPTIDTIVNYFWGTRYARQPSYTDSQVLLAYYYPVLNEYLFDEDYSNEALNLQAGIGINPTVTTTEDVKNHILYSFTGIAPPDPIVLAVINANIPALDEYRLKHTFRYWLINKYVVGRDTRSQNIFITSPSLNTSLVNLLNTQKALYLNQQLQLNNLTLRQYNDIQASIDRTLAVLQSMYSYEQQRFLTSFAVPWSQYTLPYYANLNNTFLVRNGTSVVGLPSNDSQALDAGIVPQTTDILETQKTAPPYYWPNLSNTSSSTSIYLTNLSNATSTFNLVYDMNEQNFLENQTLIQGSNSYIYSEYLSKSANAVCPIESAKYSVFQFRSPVRQTMQVETLPRPTAYRVPAYNQSNYDSNINYYFDTSYNYLFTSTFPYAPNNPQYEMAYDNLPSTNLYEIPGWTPSTANPLNSNYSFTRQLSTSVAQYSNSFALTPLSYNRALYTSFTTPQVSSLAVSAQSSFTYSLNLSVQFAQSLLNTSTFVTANTPYKMFVYQNRGGFQADVLCNRSENPLFYKYSATINSSDSNATIQFTTYPNQEYYVILRPDALNFGISYPIITPYFTNSFTLTQQTLSIEGLNPATDVYSPTFNQQIATNFNYAQLYDSNWIQLPTQSNLWSLDPTAEPINRTLVISNVPIGYDTNGVSTDFTDYIPYLLDSATYSYYPENALAIDPINKYLFQSNAPYNSTTQTYLYTGGANAVYTPGLGNQYTPSAVAKRQTKLCHYYSVNYLPESDEQVPLAPNLIGNLSTAQVAYTKDTTLNVPIPGYSYGGGTQSTIQLSRGALGFNFIPTEGVWDVKKAMFRSAIEDYENDPNQVIKYLGVYNLGAIMSTNTLNLTMSSAILVLSNSSRVSYTSNFTFEDTLFDKKGGTYYEFTKDTSFVPNPELPVLGYIQNQGQMSDQPESMYTFVAFTSNGAPTTIKAMSGSAIPYPFYNNPFVSTAYLDGTPSYNSNQGILFPSTIGAQSWGFVGSISSLFAPPANSDGTQSQFALSVPIGTSVVPYKKALTLQESSNFIYPWTTTMTPTKAINVAGYTMLQDTNFNIYEVDSNTQNRNFSVPKWLLTGDQIFSSYEGTSLVSATGNSRFFYFLGLSNDNNIQFVIRIKRYDPVVGALYDYLLDNTFVLPFGGTVRDFTFNDFGQMVIAYQDTTATTSLYYNLQSTINMQSVSVPSPSTVTMSMDPTTSTLYWLPLNSATNEGTEFYKWEGLQSAGFPGTQYSPTGTWTGLAVNAASNVPSSNDRLFLINQTAGFSSNLYFISDWSTSQVTQVGTSTTSPITSIQTGFGGSLWLTAANQPTVWGTRNTEVDIAGTIQSAWQIFYPFQKIVLEKIANTYNPMVDLTYLQYPEYPHTALFYYRDSNKFTADTSNKWGMESTSNFTVSDTVMSGFYFNGYSFNVPLVKSDPTDLDKFQYLTVRAYSPTEKAAPLLRFNLPNLYDFGYVTQMNLIEEIEGLGSNIVLYNANYATVLSNFNQSFVQSNSFFGQGYLPDFNGSNYNTSNFAGFASNVSTIYAGYQSNANLLSTINGNVAANIQTYISTNLGTILPPEAINRQNYADPILFSLLWYTGLLPQYKDLLEDWGLGYNLGYAKIDTPFSTYHRASSFYKILDDYIFLRLNPQYQLNRMDNTFKENFKITRDPTGQVQNFHGKLLLNNFNTYSQTFIYNNTTFNPPIGRLDHLYFQWVDLVGNTIDNNDCEWSASVAITESKTTATTLSTLPALPPMNQPRK
jgi:hypothetical protein